MCPEAEAGPNLCRIATGQYTGDGTGPPPAGQSIVGIGFRPRVVRIVPNPLGHGVSTHMHYKTDQMGALFSIIFTAANVITQNTRFTSLDADGFTVHDNGANASPNAAGIVYDYEVLG